MHPLVVATIEETRATIRQARSEGKSVGLVPTMGALHAGHASLLRAARAENGFVVATIFVNPTQFGPNEDFTRYPRTLEQDLKVCEREGVDMVLTPEPHTIYPPGWRTSVEVEGLQSVLEGASRPGHFRGVATVVLKLFNIVQADRAYFGQKDGQQVRVIQQMVGDLNVPVEIVVCPTVREPDGLALSSRNRYLNASHRSQAVVLSQTLKWVAESIQAGERRADILTAGMKECIARAPDAVVDYAIVVDALRLCGMEIIQGTIMAALAVKFGTTRLIDNAIVQVPPLNEGRNT